MGLFSRLFGSEAAQGSRRRPPARGALSSSHDTRVVERYRYMIQTAPPETLERAHAEAFAQLTQEQRQLLLRELAEGGPAEERDAVLATADDPRALARVATRAEIREPGFVERAVSRSSFGGRAGASGLPLLSSFAAGFVGSWVAQSFFASLGGFPEGALDARATLDADAGGGPDGDDLDGEALDLGDFEI